MSSLKLQLNDGRSVKDALQILRRILKNHKARHARVLARSERENKYDEDIAAESDIHWRIEDDLKGIQRDFKLLEKIEKRRVLRRTEKPTDKTAGRNKLR